MTDRHHLHFTGRNVLSAPASLLSAITSPGMGYLDGRELCAQADPDIFHPSGKGATGTAAKLICAACPLQEACLQAALDRGERYGIWGGLTSYERNRLHRTKPLPIKRVPVGCGTNSGYYRHQTHGEIACDDCKAAHAKAERKRAARVAKRTPGICRATGQRFDSAADAAAALASQPATARVFPCRGCDGWHITTRPRRGANPQSEELAA